MAWLGGTCPGKLHFYEQMLPRHYGSQHPTNHLTGRTGLHHDCDIIILHRTMVGSTRSAADGIDEASETEAMPIKTQTPDNHSCSLAEKNDESSELATNKQGNAQPADHAIEKVKAIPELMEAILSHLEVVDLLAATRVSKGFKALIDKSPTLQKNLFLLPIGGAAPTARFHPDPQHNKDFRFISDYNLPFTITKFCPLLRRRRRVAQNLAERSVWGWSRWADFYIKTPAVFEEPWVNMYLTSPPATKILVQFSHGGSFEKERWYVMADRIVEQKDGVTFASLLMAAHMDGDVTIAWNLHSPVRKREQFKTDTTFHHCLVDPRKSDNDQVMRATWLGANIRVLDNVVFPTELELAELYSEMERRVNPAEQSGQEMSNVYCPKIGKWAMDQRPTNRRLEASSALDDQE